MGCCANLKVYEEKKSKQIEIQINDINNQDGKLLTGADEITLIYNTGDYIKGDKLKLFGEQFVINNKNKCKIEHNKKEYELVDYFELPEINKKKNY